MERLGRGHQLSISTSNLSCLFVSKFTVMWYVRNKWLLNKYGILSSRVRGRYYYGMITTMGALTSKYCEGAVLSDFKVLHILNRNVLSNLLCVLLFPFLWTLSSSG